MRDDAGRIRQRFIGAGAAVAVVFALAGCASAPEPRAVATTESAAPRAISTEPALPRMPSSTVADEEQSASRTSRASAVAIARSTMAAFCRPALTAAVWLAALKPYLTLEAAGAYATVLPERVPCQRVTGAASPIDGDEFTQSIRVPTDAGACVVVAQRADARAPWRVGRIVLPGRVR